MFLLPPFCVQNIYPCVTMGLSVVSHAPVANMQLLISSKDKFHLVSGLREVLFQLHKLGLRHWASRCQCNISETRSNRQRWRRESDTADNQHILFTWLLLNSHCTYWWGTILNQNLRWCGMCVAATITLCIKGFSGCLFCFAVWFGKTSWLGSQITEHFI